MLNTGRYINTRATHASDNLSLTGGSTTLHSFVIYIGRSTLNLPPNEAPADAVFGGRFATGEAPRPTTPASEADEGSACALSFECRARGAPGPARVPGCGDARVAPPSPLAPPLGVCGEFYLTLSGRTLLPFRPYSDLPSDDLLAVSPHMPT